MRLLDVLKLFPVVGLTEGGSAGDECIVLFAGVVYRSCRYDIHIWRRLPPRMNGVGIVGLNELAK